MVDRTRPVAEGLGHIVDGYEYHYPAGLTKPAWRQSNEPLATTTTGKVEEAM